MLKAWLEAEHGVTYASQSLVASDSGLALMDPLSLNDLPGVREGVEFNVEVRIEGSEEAGGKFASKSERK